MGISRICRVAWLSNAALVSLIITSPASQTLKDAAALKAAEDEETEEASASEAANKISESLSSERDAIFAFKDKMKSGAEGAGKDGSALLQSSWNNSSCNHYGTL